MATIEDGLKAFLAGSPPALGARIYSHKAPQNATQPYLIIYRISVTPRHGHRGHVAMTERLFQLSVFGRSQSAVLEIADALRIILDGYSGAMGSYTVGSVLWSDERYSYNSATDMHQMACDFRIIYAEPS